MQKEVQNSYIWFSKQRKYNYSIKKVSLKLLILMWSDKHACMPVCLPTGLYLGASPVSKHCLLEPQLTIVPQLV